jgi:hypothetical protein
MTEGNFVDYVKIYVSSEREEKDLRICIEKIYWKVGQMEEMVVVEDMFIL